MLMPFTEKLNTVVDQDETGSSNLIDRFDAVNRFCWRLRFCHHQLGKVVKMIVHINKTLVQLVHQTTMLRTISFKSI